jgi:hypothetical protein
MRYKVTEHQLDLLNQNFILIEDGLLLLNESMILESSMPQYIVSMWVSSYPVEIRIGTHSGNGGAMAICRKLFKNARIFSAKSA